MRSKCRSVTGQPGLSAIVVAFVVLGGAFAAAQQVPQLTVGRLSDGQRPEIDGRVDENVWSLAEPFSTFTQQEPNEGEPATERTETPVPRRSRHSLYWDCLPRLDARRDCRQPEPPGCRPHRNRFDPDPPRYVQRRAERVRLRDQSVRDRVRRPGDGEGQTAGNTFVPSGSAGSQRGQLRAFNTNWDADWTVRANITERGWEAEFAIPLKTLRYSPGDGPDVGRQRHAQHPAQERTGLPCAGSAWLYPSARLGGRQAQRPQPAEPARCEVHALRVRVAATTTGRCSPIRST